MKVFAGIIPLILFGCAGTQTSDTGPAARCETTDCFFERDVRDFEIIDRQTLIVYVGRQRCPFVLELDGFDCDLTFTPEVQFFQGSLGQLGGVSNVSSGQVCSSTRSLYVYSGILDPRGLMPDSRIDPRTGRQTDSGGFDSPIGGGAGGRLGDRPPLDPANAEDVCRVRDIRSINDDQLIELYVDEGVMPPPPPIGSGEIEVPPEADTADADASGSVGGDATETGAPNEGTEQESESDD